MSYSIFYSPDIAYVYHAIRTEHPLCRDGYGEQAADSLWCFHVVIVSPGSCCGLLSVQKMRRGQTAVWPPSRHQRDFSLWSP